MVPSERAGECKKQTREQYNWFKVIFVIFLALSQRHKQIAFWQAAPWRELWLKCDYNAYLNQRWLISCLQTIHILTHITALLWQCDPLAEEMPFCWGGRWGWRVKRTEMWRRGTHSPNPSWPPEMDWLRIITAPFAPNGQDGLTELYFTARCWSPLLHTHT